MRSFFLTFFRKWRRILIEKLLYLKINYLIKIAPFRHARALKKIKSKDKITVAFFALNSSLWKYDVLFNLLSQDHRYKPIIFICPVVDKGQKNMLELLIKTKNFFLQKGYDTIDTYQVKENRYIDIKKEYNPDIIFYDTPYDSQIYKEYNIYKFMDKLTCYVPYSYMVLNHEWAYNLPFHNLCWTLFYPNNLYADIASKKMVNKGFNIQVSGYPKFDEFLKEQNNGDLIWKVTDKNLKRIIWAPHHTIEQNSDYNNSNFLMLHEFMIELTKTYKSKIQFAFKPHPLLKVKLYDHKDWGIDKTDNYFNYWLNNNNTTYLNDNYVDLFKTSDALIHDCASFTIEYLQVNKPTLYICNNFTETYFSELGQKAFNVHYKSFCNDDIIKFVDDVVLEGNDPKFIERKNFYDKYLRRDTTASQSIINYLNIKING